MRTKGKWNFKSAKAMTEDFMFEHRRQIRLQVGHHAGHIVDMAQRIGSKTDRHEWTDSLRSAPTVKRKLMSLIRLALFDMFARGDHEEVDYAKRVGMAQGWPLLVSVRIGGEQLYIFSSIQVRSGSTAVGAKWR